MPTLFHVTTPEAWDKAALDGEYRGDSLDSEGFLHCATEAQLAGVLDRYFRGRSGLIVLRIDPDRVLAPVIWEGPTGTAETFPHIYGPLNVEAVIDTRPLPPIDRGNIACPGLPSR